MQKQYGDEASLVALFTFVARDPLSQKAVAINPLRPSSEADRALFAERQRVADERRAARRAASQGTSTPSARPSCGGMCMVGMGGADVVYVMAGLPWELKAPKVQRTLPAALCLGPPGTSTPSARPMVLCGHDVGTCSVCALPRVCVSGVLGAHAGSLMGMLSHTGFPVCVAAPVTTGKALGLCEGSRQGSMSCLHCHISAAHAQGTEEAAARRWADSQLAEARTMVDLPALAPPDAILMGATAMQNTFTCQPQVPLRHRPRLFLWQCLFLCAVLVLSSCKP